MIILKGKFRSYHRQTYIDLRLFLNLISSTELQTGEDISRLFARFLKIFFIMILKFTHIQNI